MNANRHDVITAAEQDAQTDSNKLLWFAAGLALNVIGILIAYVYQPVPTAMRLHGKSDEDVLFYTDAYKAKTRQIQLIAATIGFIVSVVLIIILVIAFFSFFLST